MLEAPLFLPCQTTAHPPGPAGPPTPPPPPTEDSAGGTLVAPGGVSQRCVGPPTTPHPAARRGEWPEVKPPPLPPSRVTGHAARPSRLHFSGFHSCGGGERVWRLRCRVGWPQGDRQRVAQSGPGAGRGPSAPRSIDDLPPNLVFVARHQGNCSLESSLQGTGWPFQVFQGPLPPV